jgi:hypothetical protein
MSKHNWPVGNLPMQNHHTPQCKTASCAEWKQGIQFIAKRNKIITKDERVGSIHINAMSFKDDWMNK